jgi:hypothetical protein
MKIKKQCSKTFIIRSGIAETDSITLVARDVSIDLNPGGDMSSDQMDEHAALLAKAFKIEVVDKRQAHRCPSCKCKVED